MIKILRVETNKYQVLDADGEIIKTYNQTKMIHPNDWENDVVEAGLSPSNFVYEDARESE